MLPLVELPEIVRHYAPWFASVFSPEAFTQFQRYISGLIVSDNKTVEGINRIFVIDVRNQSSLNRWFTASPCSIEALNQARLKLMASFSGTQMKPKGVLSLDDTLLTHYGKHFEKIAYLYDHTQGCYVWAHNLVNLHYSDDQPDYPVHFQLWEPVAVDALETGLKAAGLPLRERKYALKESDPKKWRNYLLNLWRRHQKKPEVQGLYQSKLLISQQLLTKFIATHSVPNLPVTFDN
ncbi:MAG: transposase [Candidatus Entotheonellia bacterium]